MTYINVFEYRDELNTEQPPCSTEHDSGNQALDYDDSDYLYQYTIHVFYVDGEMESEIIKHDLDVKPEALNTLSQEQMGLR